MEELCVRKRLGRIRCLQESINCLKEGKPLPPSVCYVPNEVEYKTPQEQDSKCVVKLLAEPRKSGKVVRDLTLIPDTSVFASGEDIINSDGKWLRVKRYKLDSTSEIITFDEDTYMLLYGIKALVNDPPIIHPVCNKPKTITIGNFKKIKKPQTVDWEYAMESQYMLTTGNKKSVPPPCTRAVKKLQEVPENWTILHDNALAQLLSADIPGYNSKLGSLKTYVDSLEVSSGMDDDDYMENLTDGDSGTYWESDGQAGEHWILLTMKSGMIIQKLSLTLDKSDDSYFPVKIAVMGGKSGDSLSTLYTKELSSSTFKGRDEVAILHGCRTHYPQIKIVFQECDEGGIDVRVRGIHITVTEERYLGFSVDHFKGEALVRFPSLDVFTSEQLYGRHILLLRFIKILDSVLPYIVPACKYTLASHSSLEFVRQILPLSKRRMPLIDYFLKASESAFPDRNTLFINRKSAMEHRSDPTHDPEYKNSVFSQIYEGLKPKDKETSPLDYRWPSNYDQWWECKFASEGIIDQGGGFRDSLSDISEELCPCGLDVPVPLPFFIQSPNQLQDDSNTHRDCYTVNPACQEFIKYDWLGQLMGACLRSKEVLVLSLPAFFWKKLVGERVFWEEDFSTVDAALVKQMRSIKEMTQGSSWFNEMTWRTLKSDKSEVILRADAAGNAMPVDHKQRLEYVEEVIKVRMSEAEQQIDALRKGLLKVVPQAVLDLLTWQELERKVCGDPDISVEALKKSARYDDDLDEEDGRVRTLWQALKNFSNDDRSRFLRFVTGRKRLPALLYISTHRWEIFDSLPESSTCANMLYLPKYSSVKIAEEKLRYAVYNCMEIDTDTTPNDDY